MEGWTPSPMDKEAVKSAGWKELGILVIDVHDRGLSDAERAFIENIGQKKFGRRYIDGR